MMLGVSTSVLKVKSDLEALLAYEPDLVEFYTYPVEALARIRKFCADHGITPALHTPTPHPQLMSRYCPTGPDAREAAAAVEALEATVRCAADLGAQHVVAHFPTPYPPYPAEGFEDLAGAFLSEAARLSRAFQVPVLIENMTHNPHCARAEQYALFLKEWPTLGMCLDIGHAHQLGGPAAVQSFADVLGSRIRSVHLYDNDRSGPGHRPYPAPGGGTQPQVPYDVVAHVLRACRPSVVVLEHGAGHGHPDRRLLDWLREPAERLSPRSEQ
ncbi:sugar phosphate isomerase/epimerase family protein [Streptomyces sp. NBC_01233]|uniref:sugar phosphate isomerase/epimerase family protein n=1 Tax=Streptomyces sp. NBC_01233 TaxID=2903787 RepID=UPI002E122EEC|nr:sugar phosphate isomerase/epimerase [Streptomyces sp. NBC_01233]